MGLDDFFLLSAVSVLIVPETTVLMTSACRILIVPPPPPPEADPLEDLVEDARTVAEVTSGLEGRLEAAAMAFSLISCCWRE